ncbi:hypothetical protein N9H49_05120 [Luminiphilus sp.]|nr:hypothetical protein [Luminiphilus sp.]
MKRILLLISLMALLNGCATSATDMLKQEPQLRLQAIATEDEFRDCVFRWADHPAISLQYHPDGVWARDSLVGSPIFLATHSGEEVAIYLSWGSKGKWEDYSGMVEKCNAEPNSLPPEGIFIW